MTAIDLTFSRIPREEGFRAFVYSDKTGKRVTDPGGGNLTWLYGLNLETEGTQELGELVARWKLGKVNADLMRLGWYVALPEDLQSVCLDIAFNGGEGDLFGYPKMIAAMVAGDRAAAAAQCTEKDPHLDASRYAPLRAIILNGATPS